MTDQELLHLAALASMLEIKRMPEWIGDKRLMRLVIHESKHPSSKWVPWNPLNDDGDALRLAVHLGIEWRRPMKSRSIGRVVKVWFSHDGNPRRSAGTSLSEPVHGCTAAAVRRAIVRAAAEIGLRMEKEVL